MRAGKSCSRCCSRAKSSARSRYWTGRTGLLMLMPLRPAPWRYWSGAMSWNFLSVSPKGREPIDDAHLIVSCLMHDIGYVRGVLKGDREGEYIIDAKGRKTSLQRGSSDAALLPHHVDRSILFVLDRLRTIDVLDAQRIARAIEITRFPFASEETQEANEEGWLLRAADLVGQLGDPNYLRKTNALFYEFEECGTNRQLGYTSPADVVEQYPQFFYNSVAPRIQLALRYLNVTSSGRQWIANLYSNLFLAERGVRLSGPQTGS